MPANLPKQRAIWTRALLGGAIVVTLGCGIYLVLGDRSAEPTTTIAAQPEAVRMATSGAPQSAEPKVGISAPNAVAPGESLSQAVERLAKTGRPDDAYAAARILDACFQSRWAEREAANITNPEVRQLYDRYGKSSEKCGNLLPGQLSQRFSLAIAAAEARVPGAYSTLGRFVNENPDNQELDEAFKKAVQSNIQAADPLTLITQYQAHANCQDPPTCTGQDLFQALTLWTAYWSVKGTPAPEVVTQFLVQKLGPEKAKQAVEAGNEIVTRAQQGKK